MLHRLSVLAGSIACLGFSIAILASVEPAHAGERYGMRPAVQLPENVRQEWLFQLRDAPRVNAAGVVFANPQPRRVSRSIFSPDPFGTRAQARYRVAPPPTVPAVPVQPRSIAVRDVAPQRNIAPEYLPQRVAYATSQRPGTIVIETSTRHLYLVEPGGMATRYGVGVGKEGFGWRGSETITRKAKWPGWTPPREMIARERKKGRILPAHMPGGIENPLGARALYLGSTLYRIHGTNQPWTIGRAVSSGCIRMRNQDVEVLYERVGVGTKVVVL